MRTIARAFGLLCGAVAAAIAARYGYRTSDNDLDGYIWAFTYASVTLGGLFGHSLAGRVWRHNGLVGCIALMVAGAALVISLSSSWRDGRPRERATGRAHAGRRYRARLAPRSRKRRSERKGLRFEATDDAAVQVATARALAATAAKAAECQWRACVAETRRRRKAPPLPRWRRLPGTRPRQIGRRSLTPTWRPLGSASRRPALSLRRIAKAMRLPGFLTSGGVGGDVSASENLAMAMVIELLIVISLVASEVLERHEAPPAPAAGMAPLVEPVEAVAVVRGPCPPAAPHRFAARPCWARCRGHGRHHGARSEEG